MRSVIHSLSCAVSPAYVDGHTGLSRTHHRLRAMRTAVAAVLSLGSQREADAPQAPIDEQAALASLQCAQQ